MSPPFIHLRARSAYSLLQSAVHVKALVKLAAKHGMPALGIADANNLFGALEFSEAAAEVGVQPLIGCALEVRGENGAAGTLALFAQNAAGYAGLMRLSSAAYLESGAHEQPHVMLTRVCEMVGAPREGRGQPRHLRLCSDDGNSLAGAREEPRRHAGVVFDRQSGAGGSMSGERGMRGGAT